MSRFRLLPAGIEEPQFKQVPEGWLFTTANPWVFAPRRTYLVTDEQKPALAARVRRGRYIRLAILLPMLALLVALFIWFPMLRDFRSGPAWLVLIGFILVITVAITLGDHLAVRPLLRGLPRSTQKIGLAEMTQRQGEVMSVTALSIFTLIFLFGAIAGTFSALTSSRGGPLPVLGMIGPTLFAIAFAGMLVVKLRARDAAPEMTMERLAQRVTQAEIGWRVVAVALGLMVLIGGAGGLLAWLAPNPVEAQNFSLRNADGTLIARLSENEGLPSLQLYDRGRKWRAAMSVRDNGEPFLMLADANGRLRWTAFVSDRGSYLALADTKGIVRWSVTVADDGARVRTFDANGKEIPAK